jgi:hypothetical protein
MDQYMKHTYRVWIDIWIRVACGAQFHPWCEISICCWLILFFTLIESGLWYPISPRSGFFVVDWSRLWLRVACGTQFHLDLGFLLLLPLSRFSLWRWLHLLCFLVGLDFVWIDVLVFCAVFVLIWLVFKVF